MKKIISVVLVLAMMFSLCACNNKQEGKEETGELVNVDKNLLDVTVNLPASHFKEKSESEIMADAETKGIKSCTINEDGSVTYVMSKSKYNELLDEIYNAFVQDCEDKINDTGDYDYITDIKYDKNLSEIKVYIDKDLAEGLDFMTIITYYLGGVYYQAFLGIPTEEADVRIIEIDDATGEEIDSYSLSEMREAAAEENSSEAQ